MKTIEEAAIEYTVKESNIDNSKPVEIKQQLYAHELMYAFQAGVEFAQRWIPVDKSLPVIRPCLLKNENLHKFDTNYITYVGHHDLISIADVLKATHWRPIEYK